MPRRKTPSFGWLAMAVVVAVVAVPSSLGAATYGKTIGAGGSGTGTGLNDWATAARAASLANLPAGTYRCEYLTPAPGPWALDSNAVYNVPLVGGGIGANELNGTWVTRSQQFLQLASAHPWSIAWHGAFAAPSTGHVAYAGLHNNTSGHGLFIGSNFDSSVAARTHLILGILGGAFDTSHTFTDVADTNPHDWVQWFDGAAINVKQDGVLEVTTSNLTNFTNDAEGFSQFGSSGMTPSYATAVGAIEYCYVPDSTFAQNNLFCNWADGTSTPGTCIYDEEFNGTSLAGTKFVAHDDSEGPLMLNAGTGDTCFRHENVTVSGGMMHLFITANTRTCTQSWACTPFYLANFPGFPCNPTTHFDEAYVDTPTFSMAGYHISTRIRFGAVGGAWSDLSMWGTGCQGSRGFIGQFNGAFFAHDGGTCNWPVDGEMDIPTYINDNQLTAVTQYTYSHNGAPFFGNFFGTNWYGVQFNGSNFLQHQTISDQTANFHVYEAALLPAVAPVALSHFMFWIDGTLLVDVITSPPSWQITESTFPAIWFADYIALNAGTVGAGKSTDVDWMRFSCDPGESCPHTS